MLKRMVPIYRTAQLNTLLSLNAVLLSSNNNSFSKFSRNQKALQIMKNLNWNEKITICIFYITFKIIYIYF